MRRPAALLLLILAAGCTALVEAYPCPGTPVATFDFTGTRTSTTCAAGGPAAGANALYPDTLSFIGTIAASASGTTAALCVQRVKAEPLVGSQASDAIDVALDTRGALLAGCNPRCAVSVHQRVTGTVQRAPGGAPSGFTGTLVDEATLDATVKGADCTPCTTPCQASYALTGVPR